MHIFCVEPDAMFMLSVGSSNFARGFKGQIRSYRKVPLSLKKKIII